MTKLKMNQKGFIVIPALIWWVLGAIVVTSVAVKEGAISIQYPPEISEEISVNTPSPTPMPIYKPNPTPTSTKTPSQGQVQKVTPNNQSPTTTQGKSGRIVKYKEYCKGGKEISVYESELITKKAIDGNTYSMTKDDWDCSEHNLKQRQNPPSQLTNQGTTLSEPTITCVLPYGTFHVPQVHCDTVKAALGNLESIKKDFDKDIERIRQESDQKANEIIKPAPSLDPATQQYLIDKAEVAINQHNSQVTSCRSGVGSLSNYQQSCSQYGGSAAQACRQIAGGEWQAKYNACGTLY